MFRLFTRVYWLFPSVVILIYFYRYPVVHFFGVLDHFFYPSLTKSFFWSIFIRHQFNRAQYYELGYIPSVRRPWTGQFHSFYMKTLVQHLVFRTVFVNARFFSLVFFFLRLKYNHFVYCWTGLTYNNANVRFIYCIYTKARQTTFRMNAYTLFRVHYENPKPINSE